jgi:hypothetical protein
MKHNTIIETTFGSYATAGSSLKFATYTTNGLRGVDSNMQLTHWMEAKSRYFSKVAGTATPNLDDMILVVNSLGNSLTSLFGQNFVGNVSNTPSLLAYVDRKHQASGYSLIDEDKTLFEHLEHLNDLFNDVSKHPDQSKRDKIASLTREDIADLMETTKRVWIWFGRHRYPKGIPQDLLTEFGDAFASF